MRKSFLRLFLLSLFLLFSIQVSAQVSSEKGWFTANVVKGCWPLTVEITHNGVKDSRLFIDFEGNRGNPQGGIFDDAFIEGETKTFVYNSPQDDPFTIVVIDQNGDPSDFSDFLDIEVIENSSPFAGVATCSENEILLTLIIDENSSTTEIENAFDAFLIEFGDGNSQSLRRPTSGGETLAIPYTYTNSGTYDISITGLIDNGDVSQCSVFTATITTLEDLPQPNLQSVIVNSPTTILFNYDDLNTQLVYTLQIDRGIGFTNIATIDPFTSESSYELEDASLNNNAESYRFRIVASDICQRLQEASQEVSSIALDYQLVDITTDIQVDFNWEIATAGFSQAVLINNQMQALQTNNAQDNQVIDFSTCTEIGIFYMESTINGVLSRSRSILPFDGQTIMLPSPLAPNVSLTGNIIEISFEPTSFPLGEIQILRRSTGNSYEQIGTETDHNGSFLDLTIPSGVSEACYRITYTDECGNLSEQSTETCIELAASLRLPNAFSPNGDNVNDTFVAGDGVFNNFQMLVYNRWGDLVFQTTDATVGWDGTIGTKDAPSGSYLYRASYTNADNFTIRRSGSVALIR